jgi:hypothetical protein
MFFIGGNSWVLIIGIMPASRYDDKNLQESYGNTTWFGEGYG